MDKRNPKLRKPPRQCMKQDARGVWVCLKQRGHEGACGFDTDAGKRAILRDRQAMAWAGKGAV